MRCGEVGVERHASVHGKARLESEQRMHGRNFHLEHLSHFRDVGRVEVQRLVEVVCVLPSRTEGTHTMWGRVRAGRRGGRGEAAAVHAARRVQVKARLEPGRRARAECTSNISNMLVTLDVSNNSGWLKTLFSPCRSERRECDAGRSVER